jgi:pimeloyl-ACP methyl ester carboxylesterase
LVGDEADFVRLIDMCFTKAPYVPKAFQRCLCERNVEDRAFNEKIFADLFSNPMALEREMENCTVRTLTVWGDNDRILHYSGAQILGQALANAETIIMTRMGHCPMLERPRETASLFLKFQGLA